MRILQINVFNYKKGGSEAVYFNTIDLLKEHGNDVQSFALKWKENYPSQYEEYFPESKETRKGIITPIKNIINYFYHFEAAKKIEALIQAEKPDLAHVHLVWGQITGSIFPILKKYGIPIVLSIHDYRLICPAYTFRNGKGRVCEQCQRGKYYYCIINKCSKSSFLLSTMMASEQYLRNNYFGFPQYIDGLIYVSSFAKRIHEKYMPSLKNVKNEVFYNFVGNTITAVKRNKQERYFLFYGRLSYEKGIQTLISAFQNMPQNKLKIVGTGPFEKEAKKLGRNFANIEFVGYKSGLELSVLIENAYFIIVPSEWYENNPMTIIEGYASRIPVIGSKIGGIPEIIIEGKTGYLFTPGNIEELVRVVNRVNLLSEGQYFEFQQNVLRFADEHFNKEKYYSRLICFYQQFL